MFPFVKTIFIEFIWILLEIDLLCTAKDMASGGDNFPVLADSEDVHPPKRVKRDGDSQNMSIRPLICSRCFEDVNSPKQEMPRIHPQKIINSHIDLETFKTTVNTALKSQQRKTYDAVNALLLNWKDNDLGLKTPEKGSLIMDETEKLLQVFRDLYQFDTKHYLIPSDNSQEKLQMEISKLVSELSDKQSKEKRRTLLIVYYNGHGAVKDGRLIWSA
jgi:hypothetical protein